MQTQTNEKVRQMQSSFQEFTNLTIKTLQNFHYIKPEDWTQLKRPEHIFEKQLQAYVENGHDFLDYFEKSLLLLERNFVQSAKNIKENTEMVMNKTKNSVNQFKAKR